MNGTKDPLDVYLELYTLSDHLNAAIAAVKETAAQEVAKYGRDGRVMGDYVLCQAPGRKSWKYTNVTLHKELSAKIKKIEELAKLANETGAAVFMPDTGEQIEPAVCEFTRDTIKVTRTP